MSPRYFYEYKVERSKPEDLVYMVVEKVIGDSVDYNEYKLKKMPNDADKYVHFCTINNGKTRVYVYSKMVSYEEAKKQSNWTNLHLPNYTYSVDLFSDPNNCGDINVWAGDNCVNYRGQSREIYTKNQRPCIDVTDLVLLDVSFPAYKLHKF